MKPDYFQSAAVVSRLLQKAEAVDFYLITINKAPVIKQHTMAYLLPGMTIFEKGREALLLEETLDSVLIFLGLKDFH